MLAELRILFVCLLSFICLCYPGYACGKTDSVSSDRYALYYFCDRTDLQDDYMENALQMARIRDMLLHSPHIDSIAIDRKSVV